ncbi:FliH/SctL family protein [Falsigemmobacter faecalis]|uniref:Flagellar biosynthesis protein n=1 Tax=Falsigemmobacter faecalis TaxID=2488730 RepID=A0A3P3DJ44_9RHOB|nr:hypothetical protein [Falsigemmobacter faecalis]RRH74279.1 hypothetical protein EG244_11035 [Falsigemmobacter faecalis]
MNFPLKLEEFQLSGGLSDMSGQAAALEDSHREGFENGYQAGWDDAEAARSQTESARRDDIIAALKALNLTFTAARAEVLQALSPLLNELVSRCLPQVARGGLPGLVTEALTPWIEAGVTEGIILLCNPDDMALLRDLSAAVEGLLLHEDPATPPGEVWLRSAAGELRIDTSAALTEVTRSIEEFFTLAEQERRHG